MASATAPIARRTPRSARADSARRASKAAPQATTTATSTAATSATAIAVWVDSIWSLAGLDAVADPQHERCAGTDPNRHRDRRRKRAQAVGDEREDENDHHRTSHTASLC